MADGGRYPATQYDRELGEEGDAWNVASQAIQQIKIGKDLAHCLSYGMAITGGPLRKQLPDGSTGAEDGSVVSIVWSSHAFPDGTRRVLGWYESSRN